MIIMSVLSRPGTPAVLVAVEVSDSDMEETIDLDAPVPFPFLRPVVADLSHTDDGILSVASHTQDAVWTLVCWMEALGSPIDNTQPCWQ